MQPNRKLAPLVEARQVPALATKGLSKSFAIKQGWGEPPLSLSAVKNVSLSLSPGQTLGIVGESGCGKSTLSRMLVGTLKQTAGSIEIDGTDTSKMDPEAYRAIMSGVQMVFQSPYTSINPRLRVGDVIREPLDIHEKSLCLRAKRERVAEILNRVGLAPDHADRYPHELSGGQLQRIGIARALVRPVRVLICDEPVSALDVSVQAQVINLLSELQRTLGVSYVFVSHDLSVVASLSHSIAVMYLGRIIEIGQADQILDAPRHPYTQALIASASVPDPIAERARSKRVLSGELPNPLRPPSGCKFRTRCWMANKICSEREPDLRPISPDGPFVACHYA